jgi:hypothetical protein
MSPPVALKNLSKKTADRSIQYQQKVLKSMRE